MGIIDDYYGGYENLHSHGYDYDAAFNSANFGGGGFSGSGRKRARDEGRAWSSTGRELFRCDICQKTLKTADGKRMHMADKHGTPRHRKAVVEPVTAPIVTKDAVIGKWLEFLEFVVSLPFSDVMRTDIHFNLGIQDILNRLARALKEAGVVPPDPNGWSYNHTIKTDIMDCATADSKEAQVKSELNARVLELPFLEKQLAWKDELLPKLLKLIHTALKSLGFERGSWMMMVEDAFDFSAYGIGERPAVKHVHVLTRMRTPQGACRCDVCQTILPMGTDVMNCSECGFDLCNSCEKRAVLPGGMLGYTMAEGSQAPAPGSYYWDPGEEVEYEPCDGTGGPPGWYNRPKIHVRGEPAAAKKAKATATAAASSPRPRAAGGGEKAKAIDAARLDRAPVAAVEAKGLHRGGGGPRARAPAAGGVEATATAAAAPSIAALRQQQIAAWVAVTPAEIKEEFNAIRDPAVLGQLARMCNTFRLSAEELAEQWDIVELNASKALTLDLFALPDLEWQVKKSLTRTFAKEKEAKEKEAKENA